jgi:hypothetical protein
MRDEGSGRSRSMRDCDAAKKKKKQILLLEEHCSPRQKSRVGGNEMEKERKEKEERSKSGRREEKNEKYGECLQRGIA